MSRSRAAFMLAGPLVLLLVSAAGVTRVPEDGVAVLSRRGSGTPSLLGPGFAWRLPGFQRLDVYPGGVLTVAGSLTVASREGSELVQPYRLEARPGPQRLLELHREGGAGGASAAAARAVEDLLRRATAGTPLYDLASGAARSSLETRVTRALEEKLGRGVTLVLGAPDLPPAVRASFAKEAVYGKRRNTDRRVLLFGIDGADWDVIDPMIARGELPHLARLRRDGVWARLRTNFPTLSPLLWTTVATGKPPDRHGINDFLVRDPRTGRRVPINSTFRRVKALWNILTEAGVPSDIVAWWATWPTEKILGHMVSDRVAYSTFDLEDPHLSEGAVSPDDYTSQVAGLRLRDNAVSYRFAARFLRISVSEYQEARRRAGSPAAAPAAGPAPDGPGADAAGADDERTESINVFVRALAATETYRRVARDLLERADAAGPGARLMAVYFQGLDETEHRFAHCAPPRHPLCGDGDYRRFRDTVEEFYRYQDEILGEILARAAGWTTIVLSDHGFASGAGRPRDGKPFIEGRPGLWHDLTGVFVAAGPGIRRGEIPVVTLYDIAPTLLYLLGLPVAEDMTGKVLEGAFDPALLARDPILRVPSYEGLGEEGSREPSAGTLADAASEEMVEQLRSLGYVGGGTGPRDLPPAGATARGRGPEARTGPPGGGGVPMLLYHTNLGAVYVGKRQFDQAEAEFRKALAIDPESVQALAGLAILHEARGEFEAAVQMLRAALRTGAADEQATLLKTAELFVRMGRPTDGLSFLRALRADQDSRPGRRLALEVATGVLESAAGRPAEAEAALRRALELDPGSVAAMQELFAVYDSVGRVIDLEPMLRRALQREPRSAMHHNWLGLVLRRRGDLKGAEAAFRQSLESDPDLTGAMANLGSIYLQAGKTAEAIATLRQALEKDSHSVESRTNLIVALGLSRDPDAARALVEEAEQSGTRLPLFYNALAYALYLNGRNEEALEKVLESLRMAPEQPDARRLQVAIEQGLPPEAF